MLFTLRNISFFLTQTILFQNFSFTEDVSRPNRWMDTSIGKPKSICLWLIFLGKRQAFILPFLLRGRLFVSGVGVNKIPFEDTSYLKLSQLLNPAATLDCRLLQSGANPNIGVSLANRIIRDDMARWQAIATEDWIVKNLLELEEELQWQRKVVLIFSSLSVQGKCQIQEMSSFSSISLCLNYQYQHLHPTTLSIFNSTITQFQR